MISGSAFEKQNGFSFASPQEPFVFFVFGTASAKTAPQAVPGALPNSPLVIHQHENDTT